MNNVKMTTEQRRGLVRMISQAIIPLVEQYLGKDCLTIYAYGSVTTNDYDPESSDVDFSAFLSREIDEELAQQVRVLHQELVEQCPAARGLEGEYYYLNMDSPWSTRQTILVERGGEVHLDWGSFDPDIAEMIRGRGFRLYGKEAQYVLPNETSDMVEAYYYSYISETLFLLDESNASDNVIWHKILNCCRAFYTIVNGNIPTQKRHSALWVMGRLPEYETLVQLALDYRDGKSKPSIEENKEKLRDMLRAFLDKRLTVAALEGFIKPMRTEIQMTTKCNCSCPHCGYFTIKNCDQTSVTRISTYLAELKQNWGWIDRVLLEGGEPTTEYSRLLTCIQAARDLNVPNIQVNSNLVGIAKSQVVEMISKGCNYLEVSVDAITEENWCKMRGLPVENRSTHLLYEQFLDTLRFTCSCPEVIVDFNFTPTILNCSEIEQVYRFACKYGARYFSFQNLVCSSEKIRAISLPVSKLLEGLERCAEVATHFSFPTTILMCCAEALNDREPLLAYQAPFIENFQCSRGENYLYMNHAGELRSCCFGEGLSLGCYEEGKLSAIWEGRERHPHRCPVVTM